MIGFTRRAAAFFIASVVLLAGADSAIGAPTFISKWGSCGSATGQFCGNNGVFVAPDGSVYVCDTGCPRVQVFTADGGYLRSFGSGHLEVAFDVVVDSQGNAYVTDATEARIAKFDSNGDLLAYLPVFGSNGLADYPKWIAIDASDHIYFTVGNFVHKWDTAGVELALWGGYGSGPGQFTQSNGIAVTASGRVYVSDGRNWDVQEFTSAGAFVRRWGVGGRDPGELSNPAGVAVDANGDVYVVDDWYRVHRFSPDGVHLEEWGVNGREDGQFIAPYDVAAGDRLTLFVSDQLRCDIQKFQDPSTPSKPSTWGRLKSLYR